MMTTEPNEVPSDSPSFGQQGSGITLAAAADRPPFRSTRRSLLVATAVIAVFLGLAIGAVMFVQGARERARQSKCANRLKMIGLNLANYESIHCILPPAKVTDVYGTPVLSWRVHVANLMYYDYDFRSEMDFSQRWDSPENAAYLAPYGQEFQCPSADSPKAGTTHYVAVVGPGTMWPESGPRTTPHFGNAGSLHESKRPILVVEWPGSDIHWAEPRDITVDEFLDWFRPKSRRHDSHHPGCLLYVDTGLEVHELPNDSDPETVRKLLMVRHEKNGKRRAANNE